MSRGGIVRQVLLGIGVLLLTLILAAAALFTCYRWRGPSEAQRNALALMRKDYRPSEGVNAFPLIWLMQYDVSDKDTDAWMAKDIAEVRRRIEAGELAFSYRPSAPKLKEASEPFASCKQASECFASALADPETLRDGVGRHPIVAGRAAAFEGADYYWNVFPMDYRSVLASDPGEAQRIWFAAYALRYIDGDHAGAIAGVCRNIEAWRRLRGRTDSILSASVAMAAVDSGLRFLAEMVAVLPAGERMPDTCKLAVRPIEAADVGRCSEMAGEFAISTSASADLQAGGFFNRLVFDPQQSMAWNAELNAVYCGDTALKRSLADERLSIDDIPRLTRRPECIASLIGCILADIAAPAYLGYDARTLDHAAHLRLAATLLWLRDSPGSDSFEARFDRRPAQLRTGRRATGVDAKSQTIFVQNLQTSRSERFELPLPRRAQ